jgi:hypothetical protein
MTVLDKIAEALAARTARRRLGYGSEETVRRDASGRILERVTTYSPSRDEHAAVSLVEEFAPSGFVARTIMRFRNGERIEARQLPNGWVTQQVKFDPDGRVISDYAFAYEGSDVIVTTFGPDGAVIDKTRHPRRLL